MLRYHIIIWDHKDTPYLQHHSGDLHSVAPKIIDLDICRLDLDLNIGPYYISGNIHLVIEDIAVRRID